MTPTMPDPTPQEVVEARSHEWHQRLGLTYCRVCGYIQNDKNRDGACRGPASLKLKGPDHG